MEPERLVFALKEKCHLQILLESDKRDLVFPKWEGRSAEMRLKGALDQASCCTGCFGH